MRTVDVYNENYVTNATNVKNALETYGTAWFSSIILDTESEQDHAHVKCYIQSHVDPVLDIDFQTGNNYVYLHIGETDPVLGWTFNVQGYNNNRIKSILFTDNGIVLILYATNGVFADNSTFIIGKDVDGNLCGYYIAYSYSTADRYTIKYDTDINTTTLYTMTIKLASPSYSWYVPAAVSLNNSNNPYVIAYPFVSRYGVSDKVWRIQDSFYYTAKTAPFMIHMNNKTYLTVANGSMLIETA